MQIEAETQPAAEPEVTETPEATVVSESAPEPQPEVVADVEEPVIEEPATPVAIAAADSILAKYNAISAERDSLRAELVAAKGQLSREREALARLEASLGLAAARVVPVIENASPEAADPVAEYIAAVESGDRKKAASLFEKHKAAIWQHRNKISKA
jgi:hypothetical protein